MREFLVMAIALALLFGCPGTEPEVQQKPTAEQPAAEQQAPAEEEQGAAGALESFLGALQGQSGWMVTYLMSGTDMQASELSQYVMGGEKLRTDFVVSGTETRTYILDKDFYTCTNDGAWTCFKFEMQESASDMSYQLGSEVESNPNKYTITADGTMEVAGVTASCYRIVSDEGTTRYCVSAEGVPLYIQTNSGTGEEGTMIEMKATTYSTQVSEADFALPAEAQEMQIPSAPRGGEFDACSVCDYLTGEEKTECLESC